MATRQQAPWAVGLLVAVTGALALVLGGFGAEGTTATGVEKFPDYGSRATFKASCETAVEDEPAGTFTDLGNDGLFCQYPDGEIITCDKDGNDCYDLPRGVTRPPDTHMPVDGGGVLDGGGTDPLGEDAGNLDSAGSGDLQTPPVQHRHHHQHGHHRHHR
jgi:hypothetical protein